MGIFPIWGYQLIVGFTVAHFLKLNKMLFFIAANISIPPMIPVIIYLSYVTGSFILGNGNWEVDMALSVDAISSNLKQYLIGAVVFSVLAGVFVGAVSYFILTIKNKLK